MFAPAGDAVSRAVGLHVHNVEKYTARLHALGDVMIGKENSTCHRNCLLRGKAESGQPACVCVW